MKSKWFLLALCGLVAALLVSAVLPGSVLAQRGPSGGGRRGMGVLVEIQPDRLVIQTVRGAERTFPITAQTQLRLPGGESASLDELQLGQWIVVTEQYIPQAGWQARTIVVLPEASTPGQPGRLNTVGRVVAVDTAAGAFTLERLLSGSLVLHVTGETRFNGPTNSLSALQIGQTAAVVAKQENDGSWTALSVFAIAQHRHFAGEILVVDLAGSSFSLRDALDGAEVTFKTSAETHFLIPGAASQALASLQPGMMVGVQARPDGAALLAERVIASRFAPLPSSQVQLSGRILEISASTLSITTFDGQTVTVNLSAETVVRTPTGRTGQLADLRVGRLVAIGATQAGDGSLQAIWIVSGGFAGPGALPQIVPPRFVTPNDAPPRPRLPRRGLP